MKNFLGAATVLGFLSPPLVVKAAESATHDVVTQSLSVIGEVYVSKFSFPDCVLDFDDAVAELRAGGLLPGGGLDLNLENGSFSYIGPSAVAENPQVKKTLDLESGYFQGEIPIEVREGAETTEKYYTVYVECGSGLQVVVTQARNLEE